MMTLNLLNQIQRYQIDICLLVLLLNGWSILYDLNQLINSDINSKPDQQNNGEVVNSFISPKKCELKPPTTILSPTDRSSKVIKIKCPGKKVAIRSTPNVKGSEIVGYIHNGDVIEVYQETIGGFFRFIDKKVS